MDALERMNAFVGIPFEWGGDTMEGASCWGLVTLVQREVFGRVLPKVPHGENMAFAVKCAEAKQWAVDACRPRPIRMDEAEAGDVLHMRSDLSRERAHIGVFASGDLVLHTEEQTGSIMERMDSERFSWRPLQAYRL